VVVLIVYAVICITSIITSVFKRVTRNVHYLRIENKLKEGLLNETKRENLEVRSVES
jgi:hypothetical protein